MDIKDMERFEDVVVQSNLQGYYTKRVPYGSIEHNHRKVFVNEVVFDIDTHNRSVGGKIEDHISSRLVRDDVPHTCWDTSRSNHIHAFFYLSKYSKELRGLIRKAIITYYSRPYDSYLDMKTENTPIRDFWSFHEKTGKRKRMTYQYAQSRGEKMANVPERILKPVIAKFSGRGMLPLISKNFANKGRLRAFLGYCGSRSYPDGGRNQVLFKNVAIATYLLNATTQERRQIFGSVISHNKDKKIQELQSWYAWCQKKRNVEVNYHELQKHGFYNHNTDHPTNPK